MRTTDPRPEVRGPTLAARVRAARGRGAYTIDVAARLARVDPSAVVALENGDAIADIAACERILEVLGLRRDRSRSPASALNLARRCAGQS